MYHDELDWELWRRPVMQSLVTACTQHTASPLSTSLNTGSRVDFRETWLRLKWLIDYSYIQQPDREYNPQIIISLVHIPALTLWLRPSDCLSSSRHRSSHWCGCRHILHSSRPAAACSSVPRFSPTPRFAWGWQWNDEDEKEEKGDHRRWKESEGKWNRREEGEWVGWPMEGRKDKMQSMFLSPVI